MSDQHRTIEPTDEPDLERMDLEAALHELLVGYVERGVPELVVLGVLREQARAIERNGYLPRRYGSQDVSRFDRENRGRR